MVFVSKFIKNISYTCDDDCNTYIKLMMVKDDIIDFLYNYSVMELMILIGKLSSTSILLYCYINIINKFSRFVVYTVFKFEKNNYPIFDYINSDDSDSSVEQLVERLQHSDLDQESENSDQEPERSYQESERSYQESDNDHQD